MNTLKSLFIAFFLCLGLTHSTTAQDILSPKEKQQVVDNVNRFITEINLSEADKPAFREILRDFFVGVVAVGATNFAPKTNRKVFRALVKGRDSRMKDLLSREQYKVYKVRVKEVRTNLIEMMSEES